MVSVAALTLALLVGPSGPQSESLRPLRIPPPPMLVMPVEAPPELDARSWMAWSVKGNAELGSKNPDLVLPFASITKLMTAMLAVEHLALTNPVTISATADATPIGFLGQPDVRQGEEWTVRDLLANVLVQSGNDAAVALAEAVSGSSDDFVELMNARAAALGMTSTVFKNPNGLDVAGHVSTARDLVALGVASLDSPTVLRIARIKHIDFDPGNRPLEVTATNRLLGQYPGYLGLKTGDTAQAGQVLLSYTITQHDEIVAVVLGSSGRRVATRELVTWAAGTLGPRDHFFAPILTSDLSMAFPDWYLVVLAAAQPLDSGSPTPPEGTPLTDDLDRRFRELLPGLLGGDP